MESDTYLDAFITKCKTEISSKQEQKYKDIGDYVLAILITSGLKTILPELKQWIKLGTSAIVLKRMEIERRLEQYAARKELDMEEARKAAHIVAENVTKENITALVEALEHEQNNGNSD